MDVWFVRSNGETAHNNPSTVNYVPGEPPDYPERKHNYREKCLRDGFARIGWPNTGDLRQIGLGRLAINGYAFGKFDEIYQEHHQRYLIKFAEIRTGDLILIPADTQRYDVHIGVAGIRDRKTREISLAPGLRAYDYFHDIPNKEWYECAHRVGVLWGIGIYPIADLGGVWLRAFGSVNKGKDAAIKAAKKAGLPIVV
jgi:hypothetical protein